MIRLSGSGVAGAPQPLQWQPAAADSVNKLFINQTSSLSFIAIWRQIGSSRNIHVRMRTTLVQSSWQTCIMYINFDDLYNSRIVGIILLSLTKHDSTRSTSTSSTAPSSDKARRRMVLTIHTSRAVKCHWHYVNHPSSSLPKHGRCSYRNYAKTKTNTSRFEIHILF